MFVVAATFAVPEGAVTGFLAGARTAVAFLGGGFTAAIGKVSNMIYGNKIMSQKKLKCWKENLAGKLRKLQAENSEDSQPIEQITDSISNNICSEVGKLPVGEFLTEEVNNLNKWSGDLKRIILSLKEIKRKFEELQPT